jgi:adenine-specific DNA glycosylase
MAQQTQVARVLERYGPWLRRWSTARTLAAATPTEVLTDWVGLGYNRRALRLREACAIVVRDGWPRDSTGLRALPGVGPYTAAAVASFAFGERVAAVDTNVRRIADRIGARPKSCCRPTATPTGTRRRWSSARRSAPPGRPAVVRTRPVRGVRRAGK